MFDRIQINPLVCHGKPVIKGTRVLVSTILAALSGGDDIETILADYTNITREDIFEILKFASKLSQFEDVPYEASIS